MPLMGEGHEEEVTEEKARRVLQAAVVEAYGRSGVHVLREPVMDRANIRGAEEFFGVARHLERMGCIAQADEAYSIFVLTPEGLEGFSTNRKR